MRCLDGFEARSVEPEHAAIHGANPDGTVAGFQDGRWRDVGTVGKKTAEMWERFAVAIPQEFRAVAEPDAPLARGGDVHQGTAEAEFGFEMPVVIEPHLGNLWRCLAAFGEPDAAMIVGQGTDGPVRHAVFFIEMDRFTILFDPENDAERVRGPQ